VLRDTSYYFCDFFPACQNGFSFWATPQIDNNSIKIMAYSSGTIQYYTKLDFMGNIIWKRAFNKRQADAVIGSQIPLGNGFTFLGGFAFADDTTNTADNWYIIVDDEGCDTMNCSLSVLEYAQELMSVSVYPNPSNGIFNINIEDVQSTMYNVQCKVFDITGKEIYNNIITNNQSTINIMHLPSGIYFLQVCNEQVRIVKKVVISH
jgi:hypothetical protein